MKKAKVVVRSKYDYGNNIGTYDSNPMLNTMVYDVYIPDDTIRKYRANFIADNMYFQVDSEGIWHYVIYEILEFDKDTTAVQEGDQYIIIKSGQHRIQKSTVG